MPTIIIEILSLVCTAAAICLGYYAYVKKSIESRTIDAINFAENMSELTESTGEQKMEEAVLFLKANLPPIVKPFVTDEMIRKAVQIAFDKIEEYVKSQINEK